MGVYTTVAAVQSEFKGVTFAAGTAVTTDDVDEFIIQEEFSLEGELSTVYNVPITGSQSISIMKRMSTLMVKARIMDILPVKTGKSEVDQGNPADGLRKIVSDMLEKLREKKMLLPDATLKESSGGVKSYTSENEIDHIFQRDIDQW